MHHGENWGNVVTIMMLLLVSVIIYYYINTFITLHQCTFNLLFALFSTLFPKTSPMFLAITRESIVGFSGYLAVILMRKYAIKRCYIFPPHPINASALPCETENTKIYLFHVNVF